MTRKYTQDERASIHRALEAALSNLWDGHGSYENNRTNRYICIAISDTTRWVANRVEFENRQLAKDVVHQRLQTRNASACTFENWLIDVHGMDRTEVIADRSVMTPEEVEALYVRVQARRKEWLMQLIEEFSK